MPIEIVRKSELSTQKWSGGRTTQLFIYPLTASYSERSFLCRISTATVEQEKSEFTQLPGINRLLMILEGELHISHKNNHSTLLKKFETDYFSGNWETSASGKAIDFNVMTTGSAQATVKAIELKTGNKISEEIKEAHQFTVLYFYSGNAEITLENQKISLCKGDIIQYENPKASKYIEIYAISDTEIICAEISM